MTKEMHMTETDILNVLTDTGAMLTGHFELRSGLHSDRFFQCANALRYPDAAERLCRALVEKMKPQLADGKVDAVISPALGGLIVGHEVARALGVMSIFAEKVDGMLAMRRFKIEPGARYVVAEDVVTRGGRVQETVDIVREAGGVVAAIGLLVDRSAGNASFDAPMISLIEMAPTVWEPAACPLCEAGSKAEHPGS
jgi:orotate phosphoribosyltransferase